MFSLKASEVFGCSLVDIACSWMFQHFFIFGNVGRLVSSKLDVWNLSSHFVHDQGFFKTIFSSIESLSSVVSFSSRNYDFFIATHRKMWLSKLFNHLLSLAQCWLIVHGMLNILSLVSGQTVVLAVVPKSEIWLAHVALTFAVLGIPLLIDVVSVKTVGHVVRWSFVTESEMCSFNILHLFLASFLVHKVACSLFLNLPFRLVIAILLMIKLFCQILRSSSLFELRRFITHLGVHFCLSFVFLAHKVRVVPKASTIRTDWLCVAETLRLNSCVEWTDLRRLQLWKTSDHHYTLTHF